MGYVLRPLAHFNKSGLRFLRSGKSALKSRKSGYDIGTPGLLGLGVFGGEEGDEEGVGGGWDGELCGRFGQGEGLEDWHGFLIFFCFCPLPEGVEKAELVLNAERFGWKEKMYDVYNNK